MEHKHRIPAKALSFLLALVMLTSCISVGFTAFAAEDSYQVLANAMRADGMQGVIPGYKVSSSPDVKSKASAKDPKATSAVYVHSTAMWEAMDAFWKIAGSVRSKDVGDIVVGDNGNVTDGWTGENNTARKIAATIAKNLTAGGYMSAEEMQDYGVADTFNWFIGGYTAEYALLDEPVRGEKATLTPWTNQVFGTTGYFGVTRTRDQALLAGTKNYKQIPATLELNRRWEWAHDAKYVTNGDKSVRQYWHVLSKMDSKGNVAGAQGLAFDPAQANTKALRDTLADWDGMFRKGFFAQDLRGLSTAQLEALKANVENQLQAAKALEITNTLLYFYGLPTYLDVGAFLRKVNYHLELSPYRPYVNFFKEAKTAKALKGLGRARLNEEALKARLGLEALRKLSRNSLSVYNGLVAENGLNLSAAEDYFEEILYVISEATGKADLIAQLYSDLIGTYLTASGDGFEVHPRYLPGGNQYGNVNETALDALYDVYWQITMLSEALQGSVGSVPNFPVANPNYPATSPIEFIPFDLNDALHTAGVPLSVTGSVVQKALAAVLAAIETWSPANYFDYVTNKPDAITTPLKYDYPAYLGSAPPAPKAFERSPTAANPGAPAKWGEFNPSTAAPLDRPFLPEIVTGITVTVASQYQAYHAAANAFLNGPLAAALTTNPGLAAMRPVPASYTDVVNSDADATAYANDLDTFITAVLHTYAPTGRPLQSDYEDAIVVDSTLDVDELQIFHAAALTFINSTGMVALRNALTEQGLLTMALPVPGDYTTGDVTTGLPEAQQYANDLDLYIDTVLNGFDAAKRNYDATRAAAAYVAAYEDLSGWLAGCTAPTGMPLRTDPAYNVVTDTQQQRDTKYYNDVVTFIGTLTADQKRYIALNGGMLPLPTAADYPTFPDALVPLPQTILDMPAGPAKDAAIAAYLAGAEAAAYRAAHLAEYQAMMLAADAENYIKAIPAAGADLWKVNSEYPSAAVTGKSLLQTKYEYLVGIGVRKAQNADFEARLQQLAAVPDNAYNWVVTAQKEYERALQDGEGRKYYTDPADGIVKTTVLTVEEARQDLAKAVNNYMNLWRYGTFKQVGPAPLYEIQPLAPAPGYSNATYQVKNLGKPFPAIGTAVAPAPGAEIPASAAFAEYQATMEKIQTLNTYEKFFNPYRMSLVNVTLTSPGGIAITPDSSTTIHATWEGRYSDADVKAEITAVLAKLDAYNNDPYYGRANGYPSAVVIDKWNHYLGRSDGNSAYTTPPEDDISLYGEVRSRVSKLLGNTPGGKPVIDPDKYSIYDYAKVIDPSIGTFSVDADGKPIAGSDYNIFSISLYALIINNDYGKGLDEDKIKHAQRILAVLRGLLVNYETLHWDLMGEKRNLPFGNDWYPVRGVNKDNSLVLVYGQDEFVVRYEHIENLINKLDTIITSTFGAEILGALIPPAADRLDGLRDKIGKGQEILDVAPPIYKAPGLAALQTAVAAAQALLAANPTKNEIDKAIKAIQDAIDALELITPPTPPDPPIPPTELELLQASISKAQKDYLAKTYKYKKAGLDALLDKVNDGKDVAADDGSTDTDYSNARTAIETAMAACTEIETSMVIPPLDGDILMSLGEMRYSSEECVITDPNTGVKIILPPLDTQIDTDRVVDKDLGLNAQRRWIQSYRADVLLYLLHYIFAAIEDGGMQAWLLKMLLQDVSTSVNGMAPEQYDTGMPPEVGEALSGAVAKAVDYTLGQVDLQAAMQPFLTTMLGELVAGNLYGDMLPNTVMGLYKMLGDMVGGIFEQRLIGPTIDILDDDNNKIGEDKSLMGEDISIIPDVFGTNSGKPLLSLGDLMGYMKINCINDILISPLGVTIMGLTGVSKYKDINILEILLGAEITPGSLLKKCWPAEWPIPAIPKYGIAERAMSGEAADVYGDLAPHLKEIYRWLSNVDGDFQSPNYVYSDLSDNKYQNTVTKMFGDAYHPNMAAIPLGTAPSDIGAILGDVIGGDWAGVWNNVSVLAGVPAQRYKYNSLLAWEHLDKPGEPQMADHLQWGIETLPKPGQQRKALEDIMAFTFSGLSFVLAAVFGDSGLNVSIGEGINPSGAPNARYYVDITLGSIFEVVGPLINSFIQGQIVNLIKQIIGDTIWNLIGGFIPIGSLDLMGFIRNALESMLHINLDDYGLSSLFGDNSYESDSGFPHWKGTYDSRAGVYASLTPVNAYGKLIIPLFEMLNIDPVLFGKYEPGYTFDPAYYTSLEATYLGQKVPPPSSNARPEPGRSYDEQNFNRMMSYYGASVTKIVMALEKGEGGSYSWASGMRVTNMEAKQSIRELSRILVQAIIVPLLNFIDPNPEGYPNAQPALIPYSVGYRPLGKVLDILPNLAFVLEKQLIPIKVDEALSEMFLTIEICLGGMDVTQILNLIIELLMDILKTLITGPIINLIDTYLGDLLRPLGNGVGAFFADLIKSALDYVVNMLFGMLMGLIDQYVMQYVRMVFQYVDLFLGNRLRSPRKADLGTLLGFFGGQATADLLTFKIDPIGIKGILDGALKAKDGTPGLFAYLKDMIGVDLTEAHMDKLVEGILGLMGIDNVGMPPDPDIDADYLAMVDKIVQNESQIEGFLIELFNPQTYPCKTFMIYPLTGEAKSATGGKLNEVNYSDIWTKAKADFLDDHLLEMLDKWWDFLFAEPFLPWLWDMLNGLLGFDITNLYTRANLDAILDMVAGLVKDLDVSGLFESDIMQTLGKYLNRIQHLVDIDDVLSMLDSLKQYANPGAPLAKPAAEVVAPGLTYGQMVAKKVAALKKTFADGDRKAFSDVIYQLLAPLAPVLKLLLTGGRTTDAKGKLIETIWYGELYPNNGARDVGWFDPGSSYANQDVHTVGGTALKLKPQWTFYPVASPPSPAPPKPQYPPYTRTKALSWQTGADGVNDYVWNTKRYVTFDGSSKLATDMPGYTPPTTAPADKDKPPLWYTNTYGPFNNNYTPGAIVGGKWDKKRQSEVAGFRPYDGVTTSVDGYTTEYDPKGTFYTIGAEGNNITLLEDFLGFSGYDGYKQALIPIYEHLGVPKEDIPTFQQFVLRSTEGGGGYDGDTLFFKMLVDPILNLVDRVVDDPINTVLGILPNLLYFLTAEATGDDQVYADNKYAALGGYKVLSGTTCINECLNRLLRPVYAILDMLAPIYTVDEILKELLPMFGMELPGEMFTDGGLPVKISFSLSEGADPLEIKINLPIEISLNSLVQGLLKGIDLGGLDLSGLTNLTDLVTGDLKLYQSQNGQDDAVCVADGNLPDLLTNLIRKVIEVFFGSEKNYEMLLGVVDGIGIPNEIMPVVLQLLDSIYGLMSDHTLKGHTGADLVMSMLFYVAYDANSLVDDLLFQRNTYTARYASFFEIIANSSSPQLRRYAERARRFLNQLYGNIITPSNPGGVQKNGFVKFITDFWAKIVAFFTGIGDWFMRLIRWLFPFFFK